MAAVQIVAELGINHNGDIAIVEQMIRHAAAAGCNYVKFQTRTLSLVYSPEEMRTPQHSPFGETVGDYRRARELSRSDYEVVNAICLREGIKWFTTPVDIESVRRMVKFDPGYIKIASPQLTDGALIDEICSTGKPVILSTGMSDMRQIREAVWRIQKHKNPLTILHCTSSYPCADEEINLQCIPKLAAGFGVPVGFSSHSVALIPCYAAVALGACMIEVHFTLDRNLYGTDQRWSLDPPGLRRLVQGVRRVERCLGDGVKKVYDSEQRAMKRLRKA